MRRSLALIALGIAVSAAFAASAVAQSRFLVWTYQGIPQPMPLMEIDGSGNAVRTVATLPRGFNPYRIVMAEDNRDVLVLGRRGGTTALPPIILRVTPAGAVTTALVQNLSAGIYAAVRDADGDWLMVRSSVWPQRTMQVLRVGLGGTNVRIGAHPPSPLPDASIRETSRSPIPLAVLRVLHRFSHCAFDLVAIESFRVPIPHPLAQG